MTIFFFLNLHRHRDACSAFNQNMYLFPSYYETKAVFLAMGITALVCVTVTVFCFQTKVDASKKNVCVWLSSLWFVTQSLCWECKTTPLSRITTVKRVAFKYWWDFGERCESIFLRDKKQKSHSLLCRAPYPLLRRVSASLQYKFKCTFKPWRSPACCHSKGFSSQVDFTSCGGFLCIAAILLVIIGTVTAIVLSFHYVRASFMTDSVYSCFSQKKAVAQRGASVWPIMHSEAFFLCRWTGTMASYALCCHWGNHLHLGKLEIDSVQLAKSLQSENKCLLNLIYHREEYWQLWIT